MAARPGARAAQLPRRSQGADPVPDGLAWDGKPTKILSRSTDEAGNLQPDRKSLVDGRWGRTRCFTTTRAQTWSIEGTGRVRNVLD